MTLKKQFENETGLTFECDKCKCNALKSKNKNKQCFPFDNDCFIEYKYVEWLERQVINLKCCGNCE